METMCCFQVGLGLVRCSANPQPPARGLQTILFPFLLPEPFWLWVAIPWVCLWSLWVRCRVAEVGTLPLCSWTWPELVTRTLTGSWVLGARGTQALLGPEGSRLSLCGHHMCTLLLPSHLPLPGADHAAGGAKGAILSSAPRSSSSSAPSQGWGEELGCSGWAPSPGCPLWQHQNALGGLTPNWSNSPNSLGCRAVHQGGHSVLGRARVTL